ncbi:MAG: two-component system, cell cycle sensor histidine kinase and response regulator CckA [Thermoanaerobaculia bacterium]|jgi:PAS domain S-box-containing protein|nr:two-component system, cell cycle sensor histidine kinase and response regulator CckA [Thermoanaerobaculia bacterium]
MFATENLLKSERQAVIATGDDGAIVFWNRAAEELYGWSATEAIGRPLAEMLPPGDPLAHESVFETVRAGRSWSGTRRSGLSDDPDSVVLLTASAMRGNDGSADGFVVTSTPLDQFELPHIAADSEHLYRESAGTFPERIWILNERYETVFASQQVAAMLGYTMAEMLGAPLSRFAAGDYQGIDAHPGKRYRAAHSSQAELTLRRRDGTTLAALLETHPLFDAGGAYRGVRAVIDITERREAEEQARNREMQMRDIMTIACIAEWRWDIATDAFVGMPELWEILQVDSLEGITLTELMSQWIHPEDRERLTEAFQRTRSEGLPLDVETRFRTSRGGELVVHLRGRSVTDQEGAPIRLVGMIQDVTERRQLEQRLLQAERVSSLGRLAASVAHEFNNVLMGIQPFVDLLNRRAGADPTVALAVPRIADAVARGKRITQEMLRFTRIGEPTRTIVNVANWLQEFEPELAQLAGPAVKVTIEAAPSLTMLVDGHQLRQVFANLLVNAQHAMPAGGLVEIRATSDTIRDRTERYIDAVHFFVRDNGVGMPEETLRYIFEPLFTTRKFGGTGLGLAVAAQVIQQHKGHIFAESAEGKGSTFHILIPAGQAPKPAPSTEPATARPHRKSAREGMQITLIEDDESVGAGLAAILDLDGIAVDWVRLGRDAVDRIAAKRSDAVILDLGLPDIDGIEVYRQIAQRWPDLPVLFSTGHGDEAMLHDILSPHVAYIQKPYELSVLMAALEGVLS